MCFMLMPYAPFMQMDQAGQEMHSKLEQLAEKLEQQSQQLEQDRAATESLRAQVDRQAHDPSPERFTALQNAYEARPVPWTPRLAMFNISPSLVKAPQCMTK